MRFYGILVYMLVDANKQRLGVKQNCLLVSFRGTNGGRSGAAPNLMQV